MKPVPNELPFFTRDLTSGYPQRIEAANGTVRYVLMFPKTWEAYGSPETLELADGPRQIQSYRVLSWEEVDVSPAAIGTSLANVKGRPQNP